MPTIAWFYGIAIRMYFRDHPPPHFQAPYAEFEANVSIETGEVIEGRMPRWAARLIKEWTLAHQRELRDNWNRARAISHWSGFRVWTMIKISKIEWAGGHRLRFTFTDGAVGEFDFSGVVTEPGPMVEPLRDLGYFKRVFLNYGAPTWPNGFDIAPAWLHREIQTAGGLRHQALA
jgi:hypothetical protein